MIYRLHTILWREKNLTATSANTLNDECILNKLSKIELLFNTLKIPEYTLEDFRHNENLVC